MACRMVTDCDCLAHANVEQSATQLPLMRSSVIIGIVILLKAYLKALYSLSEEYVLSVATSDNLSGDSSFLVANVPNSSLGRRVPLATNPVFETTKSP